MQKLMSSTGAGIGYAGLCAICGTKGLFARGQQASVRESFGCPECKAAVRYRDQAAAVIDEFGRGTEISLRRLVKSGSLNDLHIYEPALGGPFVKAFTGLPNYRRSYYWDGKARGDIIDGTPFEDLTDLSFETNTFDLILTSDVMEHVLEPYKAFAEIARVLKIGGVHIFTIPNAWPFPAHSVECVRLEDGELKHLTPPRYHRAGNGAPSLVMTEYGADIVANLNELGLITQVQRRSIAIDPIYQNATFVSRKMR